jgi:ABC-2 type transport system permease protein
MTTATAERRAARPAHASPRPGSPFTGTSALMRLDLRLDRVRILIWTLAVGLGVYASVVSLDEAYPTDAALQSRGALLANPATIMMTGPAFAADHYTFGAMVANELALYVFLAVGIMSILLAVRHTRAEEESGRLELLRSMPVGRFAPATAAVVTVALANVLVGTTTTLALVAPTGGRELPVEDSIAFGAATALTGLVFAGLATVTAQLTEHARSATGMAMAALASVYLVRGIGDVIDHTGSWLSWASPFAWAQQTRLFVDLRWWPLAVSLAGAVVLFALAVSLAQRRDLGSGLRPARRGPATAAGPLRFPVGLAERLQRGSLIAWAVGVFFFAVAMGALADSLEGLLLDNPALADWISVTNTDVTGEFAAVILSFVMIAPVILAVAGVLSLKSEESTGRTETMLAAGHSRVAYLAGWLATVGVQSALLTVLGGAGVGLGVMAGTGDGAWIGEMTVAGLAYLPAILVTGGLAAALYGAAPRFTSFAWLLVVWLSVALFLGELLGVPDWAMGLSPFTHTPGIPVQEADPAPLLVMSLITALLVAAGLLGFRRRDIASR